MASGNSAATASRDVAISAHVELKSVNASIVVDVTVIGEEVTDDDTLLVADVVADVVIDVVAVELTLVVPLDVPDDVAVDDTVLVAVADSADD